MKSLKGTKQIYPTNSSVSIEKIKKLLKNPTHITYISKHIFKMTMQDTEKEIDILISEGYIEESNHAKKYYGYKTDKSEA